MTPDEIKTYIGIPAAILAMLALASWVIGRPMSLWTWVSSRRKAAFMAESLKDLEACAGAYSSDSIPATNLSGVLARFKAVAERSELYVEGNQLCGRMKQGATRTQRIRACNAYKRLLVESKGTPFEVKPYIPIRDGEKF